jgi:hypothetical protein
MAGDDDAMDVQPEAMDEDDANACGACGAGWWDFGNELLLCDECDAAFHLRCLDPPLSAVPQGDWLCPNCVAGGAGKQPVGAGLGLGSRGRGGGVGADGGGGGDGVGGVSAAAAEWADCGVCVACKDKRKFGGPGVRKARCVLKPKGQERQRSAAVTAPGEASVTAPGEASSVKRPRGRPPKVPREPREAPPEPEGGRAGAEELNLVEKVLDVRTRALIDGGSAAHSLLRAVNRTAAGHRDARTTAGDACGGAAAELVDGGRVDPLTAEAGGGGAAGGETPGEVAGGGEGGVAGRSLEGGAPEGRAQQGGAWQGGVREGEPRSGGGVSEYLCKMRGLAHVHARWLTQVHARPNPFLF